MSGLKTVAPAPLLRRLVYCLLPVLAGAGSALVLLLAAGGPARSVYADTLTYPGCAASIQACINNASAGDTILITAGDYTESLTLSKAVSLTGALSSTTILHALPFTRVLTVTGAAVDSSVVISGLTFTGGSVTGTTSCPQSCGGGLLITGTAQPVLQNLMVISNLASASGGGVYIAGSLNAANVQFISNTARGSFGGAGAFASLGANVTNSLFLSNVAKADPCQPESWCFGLGGGLYDGGALTLSSTSFVSNTGGGAYVVGSAQVSGSLFQGSSFGGGLFCYGSVNVSDSQFINNDGSDGAGLYAGGPAVVAGSQFTGNTGAYHGGSGLYASVDLTLTDSSFVSNNANGGFAQGGGAYAGGTATVTDTQFISNFAPWSGGGLFAATLIASGAVFSGNTAMDLGGGLYAYNATLTDSELISNVASAGAGGDLNNLVMTNTQVLSNTAGQCGGICIQGSAWLYGVTIAYNRALFGNGGGMGVEFGNLTLNDSSFISNTASDRGGAVSADNTLAVTGGLFLNNTALSQDAGAIHANRVLITGTQFLSNTALTAGGGIQSIYGDITGATFVGNRAGFGGGLFGNSVAVTDSVFMSNTATTTESSGGAGTGAGGGALDAYFMSVSGSLLADNAAVQDGGGLVAGWATITGTRFYSNTAGHAGGALNVSGVDRLVNSLLVGNRAGALGDDVYAGQDAVMDILHTTIVGPGVSPGVGVYIAAMPGGLYGSVNITDSIITSHSIGIQQASGVVFQDYNLFFGNGLNISGTIGAGAHSLTGDPAFVDPAGGNYHLGSGSAAIDAGTDAGVNTDFDGDPRPQGAGFDIGFDESSYTALVDVGVKKSASAAAPQPGQTLTYTLVFSNAGPNVAAGVRLTDIVPANLASITYTSSGAALTPLGGPAYAWQVASLAPGAGGLITLTGLVSNAPAGTAFTNTATISTVFTDTNPSNNTSAVSVTVANVAPVAAADVYAVAQNGLLTVTAPGLLANDTDGNNDALTATLSAGPPTGTLGLHADGSFTYTPALDATGPVTFTYQAGDGLLLSAPASVTVFVGSQPPLANAGPGQVKSVGQSVTLDGSASTDPDNQPPLAYGWHQAGGTAVILSSATLSRPTFTAPGVPAVLTFTLSVTNALGVHSQPATTVVTVTDQAITGLNAAGGTPRVLGSSTPFTASLSAGTNVSYAWGFGDGTTPATGALVSHTYALPGAFQAVLTATNSIGQVTATTTVTVDDIPLAASDTYTTPEDTPLLIAAPGVLANDTDVFPGGLTAQLASGPSTGVLALAPSGRFTYTAPANFHGLVTFTYRANDGLLSSPAATVTITVTSVNDPPTLTAPADVTTTAGTPVGPLSFTIGDVDGGPLTVTAQSSNTVLVPSNGIVLGGSGAARTVTITPAANLTGTTTITLSVSDGLIVTRKTFVLTVTQAERKLYLPLVLR